MQLASLYMPAYGWLDAGLLLVSLIFIIVGLEADKDQVPRPVSPPFINSSAPAHCGLG